MLGRKQIRRLRSEIATLRAKGGIKSTELNALATRLKRKRSKSGKEPTWINPSLPDARPVSIPNHPGDLNRFTARGILDQLEVDLDMYEELLLSQEKPN